MNYIVLDIEANDRQHTEIIEMGAVKLNEHLEIIDQYQSFVQPTIQPKLNWYIKKLTGIQQIEVDEANRFPRAFAEFLHWAGNDFTFITWSNHDFDFIHSECVRHALPCAIKNQFVNIQTAVSASLDSANPMGLKKTLEQLGFSFEGKQHRACDDAINTVKLFQYAMHAFQNIEAIKKQKLPVKPKEFVGKESIEFIKCVNILHSIRFKLFKKTTEEAKEMLQTIRMEIEKIEKSTRGVKKHRKKLTKEELKTYIHAIQQLLVKIIHAPTFNPKYAQDIELTTQKIDTILQAIEKPQT